MSIHAGRSARRARHAAQRAQPSQQFVLLSARHAQLLAAARATAAALRDGAADPYVFLEAELERNGQLPMPGQTASQLLADAAGTSALVLAATAAAAHD